MKLSLILLTAAFLQVGAKGTAQGITWSGKDVPLEKVFAAIKKQTNYVFFYRNDDISKAKRVTIDLKNVTLEQALDKIFDDQPLTYSIIEKTVIVKKKPVPNGSVIEMESPAMVVNPLIDISGRVTDEEGKPLVGASVKVRGTNVGTTTDGKGEFRIAGVSENATLEISYVGYETFTVAVNNKTSIVAILKVRPENLNEVVINKGYYTEKQRLSTGNTFTVKAKDIEKQPVNNPLLALQGRVPGLNIIQNTGMAGGSVNIRIQGRNSILSGNDPLYVVDGVPILSQLPRTGVDNVIGAIGRNFNGYGNPINYINPADIESIDVLKDADATAIYGSRAANGAILITTKKGKSGKMKFDFSFQTGWGKVGHQMEMLNTRQYLDMRYEALKNDGINWQVPSYSANDLKVWDTTRYTNWQKELIGKTARYNDINLSFSGGTATVQYLVSGTYHGQTTVFPFSKDFSDRKGTVHIGLNANSNNQRFKLQFSGSFMSDKNQLPSTDFTLNAVLLEPNAPQLLNSDGSINWAPNSAGVSTLPNNPMAQTYALYKNRTNNLISNLTLGYDITNNLKISTSLGANWMNTEDFLPTPLVSVAPDMRATTQRAAKFGERQLMSWIVEPQVTYKKSIGKSKIDGLIGSTLQITQNRSGFLYATGQLSDDMLESIQAASSVATNPAFADGSEYRYNAIFGRIGYNFNDQYIINTTVRRDGSSRFGGANRFQNFGSVGAAWMFSNESFVQEKFSALSFGKLRGSFGITGNDQIGNYGYLSTYSLYSTQVPYQGIIGLQPVRLPNPYLEWEETKKLQFGCDLGFFSDRVIFNFTYAINQSSNLLLNNRFPYTVGLTTQSFNLPATVKNTNWEMALTVVNVNHKNFVWGSSINVTIPKNKLVDFPGIANSTYATSLVIGQPISILKSYKLYGVDPQTGNYLYADKDNKPTTAPALDDRIAINLDPKLYGGFQNTIRYKKVHLDFLLQFVKQRGLGFSLYNNSLFTGQFFRGGSNQPISVLQRWQAPGDISSVGKYSTSLPTYGIGDGNYEDASFIRLKNISLSWELPGKWCNSARITNANIFFRGQNLFTITRYKGLDPESQSLSVLPPLKVFMIGASLGL